LVVLATLQLVAVYWLPALAAALEQVCTAVGPVVAVLQVTFADGVQLATPTVVTVTSHSVR
jgi:hypothetical protein